jgi:NAD(P)-dependent dehydrogenase (short-subunit alcohol dehydrogenase family)
MSRNSHERPLAGKVALVAGGSHGTGAAIAKRHVAPNFDQTLS